MMRLSPGEYVFTVAPIHAPRGAADHSRYYDVPKDLYLPGSKWFFVEAVALTHGGGSYRDVYKEGVQIAAIGTTVQALWAKAKSDIDPNERPFAPGQRVIRRYPNDDTDLTVRTVLAVDDSDHGQYLYLAPANGCHDFTDTSHSNGYVLAPVDPL